MYKINQKGIAHLLLPIILILGLVAAVYLITSGNPLKLFSRAGGGPITFREIDGSTLPVNKSGVPQTTSATIRVELSSALGPASVSAPSGTVSYKIAENPTDLDTADYQQYTQTPVVIIYSFKDSKPGTKFLWVEFKDSTGKTDRRSAPIELIGTVSGPGASLTLSAPKSVSPGDQIAVDLAVRSDIEAANIFVAKLRFPTDLLETEEISIGKDNGCLTGIAHACSRTNPKDCNDFYSLCAVPPDWIAQGGRFSVKNWVDRTYDNNAGTISIIGGVPDPGFWTLSTDPASWVVRIMFKARKEGIAEISFDDESAIYSNADNQNILSSKQGVSVQIGKATPQPTALPSARAILSLEPSNGTFNRSCNFSLNVNLNTDGAQTDGTDAIILYDPTKLAVTSIIDGKIYADYPADDIDSRNGKIVISGLSTVDKAVTGKGTLATINFSVKAAASPGVTQVNFDFDANNKAKQIDSNVVQRMLVKDILNSVVNGTYTIGTGTCSSSAPVPLSDKGDGNKDGKIDLVDLSILLSALNKKDKYQSLIDMNSDGVINTIDYTSLRNLLIAKGVFGKK